MAGQASGGAKPREREAVPSVRFPQRLLSLALLVTVALAVSLSWYASTSYRVTTTLRERHLRIEELRGVIVHLNEVLTMSARMAAATGQERWERRYNAHVAELDAAIKEARRLAAPLVDARELEQTDAANLALVEMETESFRQVRAGRPARARAILFSSEYERQKRIYAWGVTLVLDRMRSNLDRTLRAERRAALRWELVTVGVLLVLLAAWVALIRGLQRWRAALSQSVEERQRAVDQLHHRAFHDGLTGLSNRALFSNRVEHALARARRERGPLAVLFVDLDDFKTVNDSLGHATGDHLLTQVARRIETAIRPGDTVARLGGDEFGLLLEHLAEPDDAIAVARRVLEAVRAPFDLGDRELLVRASIGIAFREDHTVDPDELLRNADLAMYVAKKAGKDGYEEFKPRMRDLVLRRLELESDLRKAVEQGELVVHYQPIIAIESGRIEGAEALVRWQHPRLGLLPPAEFIPTAEQTGLIVRIGQHVLRQACEQARAWQAVSPGGRPFRISVNLSARQLLDDRLLADVREALAGSGLDPAQLVLEITETTLMQETPATVAQLRQLKDLGVQLAIDDFGTGYSSLSYLRQFPVDMLKIDKSFIDHLGRGPEDAALPQAIIKLARALDLHTVAEGIEFEDQVAELRALHCELGQGFHFARPMTAEALSVLLASGRHGSLDREQRPLDTVN